MLNYTLDSLLSYVGTQKGLAVLIGVSEAAVNRYVKKQGLPPLRAIQIQIMTSERFLAIDLLTPEAKKSILTHTESIRY